MTRKEQIKILDDKIKSNTNQYKIDRLNAEISAFSSGDLNKYEFLTREDLKYKPNVLDKAKFEFTPLGKAFSTGLDKTAEGYQEEGVIKLLKDVRDGLTGNVIIPNNRPNNRPNDNNDDNNDNDDDNGDGNNDDKIYNVLNKLQNDIENNMDNLNKKVADKEHNLPVRSNKVNNNAKKTDNYIKENSHKKVDIKKKLDVANNEYNYLLLEYDQLRKELMETKDKLKETKDKLDKDDINKKTKYIDKIRRIQEKLNYQNAEVIEFESELNKKKRYQCAKKRNDLKKISTEKMC